MGTLNFFCLLTYYYIPAHVEKEKRLDSFTYRKARLITTYLAIVSNKRENEWLFIHD